MGLYLAPPANAVVVCVDEKSQIQALDRTRPVLPMRAGIPERQTHDYIRHGTTTLFAALETATGTVTDACYRRHRHGEFLRFLKKVAAAYPGTELHVVCDNYATHKHAGIRDWLARPANQRITLHFTPTSCSWLNLVECFFSVITRQAIRRGTFTSVKELTAAIGAFIDHWNDHPRPFTWTKDADEILASIQRAKTKTNSLTHTRIVLIRHLIELSTPPLNRQVCRWSGSPTSPEPAPQQLLNSGLFLQPYFVREPSVTACVRRAASRTQLVILTHWGSTLSGNVPGTVRA